jgi:hypothetical protein
MQHLLVGCVWPRNVLLRCRGEYPTVYGLSKLVEAINVRYRLAEVNTDNLGGMSTKTLS